MDNGDGDPATPGPRALILNTWLPASTLSNGDGEQLPGVGVAPTILLIIWLQVWAMENGKAARGSPARSSGPGVRPIDILV